MKNVSSTLAIREIEHQPRHRRPSSARWPSPERHGIRPHRLAVTVRFAVIVTVHVVPLVAQSPLKPLQLVIDPAAPVSVTCAPAANVAAQLRPLPLFIWQAMPPGDEVTVPVGGTPPQAGLGTRFTVSAYPVGCGCVNRATTLAGPCATVTRHVPVPAHDGFEPARTPHPANVQPVAGVAVSVTVVPRGYGYEHARGAAGPG